MALKWMLLLFVTLASFSIPGNGLEPETFQSAYKVANKFVMNEKVVA